MIKKILFETLQRFDLKDANELQQGVLDKLEGLANGLNWQLSQSIPAGGPLSKISCVGVTNGIARFSPMVLLTAEHDVLVFDSEDQDDARLNCDLSSTYADWLNTDQSGGIFFYAYPSYEEGDTENREFFSLIDNAPTTRAINTRQHLNITFFSSLDSSFNIANENGHLPIRIGFVEAEDIFDNNPGSPFIPSNFKSKGYFDNTINILDHLDTDLPNVANNRDNAVGGFSGSRTEGLGFYTPFKKIEKQLQRILCYGTADAEDTVLIPNNSRPMFSLMGLSKRIDNNVNTIADTLSWGVGLKYTKAGSGTNISVRAFFDTPNLNAHGNQVAVVPRLNYTPAVGVSGAPAIPYVNAQGNPVEPFSADEDTLLASINSGVGFAELTHVLSNIHISFPDAYAGYQIDALNLHYLDPYANNRDLGANGHFGPTGELIPARNMSFVRHIDFSEVNVWDELSTIVTAPAYILNVAGSELTDAVGINLRLTPSNTIFTTLNPNESFMVHITGTIRKRTNS